MTDAVLSFDDAAHLAGRIGFGPEPETVAALTGLTRRAAVARVMASIDLRPTVPVPTFTIPTRRPKDMGESDREAFLRKMRAEGIGLKAWWWAQILSTPSPLGERLVLVWHNHFTSSLRKVKLAAPMWRQHQLLRQQAAGSFQTMLAGMVRDPAMLIYLDGQQNTKEAPNENLARELMELFTLGEGAYTEKDVREAARALTGYVLDRRAAVTGDDPVRFEPRQHDDGPKTILGKTAAFDADSLVAHLLAQPQTAVTVARKLARAFIAPEPDRRSVDQVAAALKSGGFRIDKALEALLLSDGFWAAEHRGTLVKSPVEMIAGLVRLTGVLPPDVRALGVVGARLGQDLFEPPNVKGWPGGTAWITAETLLARRELVGRMLRGQEMTKGGMGKGQAVKGEMAGMMAKALDRRLAKLGAGPPPPVKLPAGEVGLVDRLAALPPDARNAAGIARLLLRTPPVEADVSGQGGAGMGAAEAIAALLQDPAFNLA